MKSSERNELIDALIEGDITEADFLRLEAEMSIDPVARKAYFDRVALTQALTEEASSASAMKAAPKMKLPQSWISWRPLTAAAAGLVIGLFSASLVFGFAGGFSEGMTRSDIAVAEADFERAEMKLEQGFPSGPQAWAVDDAEVSSIKGGGKALRLLPRMEHPYSRAVQIVDVRQVGAGRAWSLELSARFMNSDLAHACRYKLRLIGFAETADALQPFPLETSDEGLVSSSQVLDVPVGADGWHGVTTVMPLPPEVKTVVIWLGASTRPQPGPKVAHWVDDVRLQLLSTSSKTNPPTLP
jgi:hypothetical protein